MILASMLLLAAAAVPVQTPGAGHPAPDNVDLPHDLYLPVALSQTVRAGKTPVGTPLRAATTQRIPLPQGAFLPSGVRLLGDVTVSTANTLTVTFSALVYRGRHLPLALEALAIAGFVAVAETGIPANGSTDRGNPDPASWTTAQVGGDQVMRSGWVGTLVNSTTQTVGSADYWGVYSLPTTPTSLPAALGPFSAGATGLFGYRADCRLLPTGGLTIRCDSTHPVLRRGDVLLLRAR